MGDDDTAVEGLGRTLWTRTLVILGVSSVAVVQPLLDLFGNNPEFFVAGRYSSTQIVVFALIITLVPPAVGIALVAAATAVNRVAGTISFSVVVGVFAVAFMMVLARTIGLDPAWIVFAAALALGAGLVVLVTRTKGGVMLARYMAAANVLFVALFMYGSPTSRLVAGGGPVDEGEVRLPMPTAPVVVIVLDELPAASIMRGDGSLNADRYPGFAKLASVSNWYRNASSQYNLTAQAVPSLLTGNKLDGEQLPTASDFPRNLFTLLGNDVPVELYESVTNMCPISICGETSRQPLRQALEDASVVYGHRMLPEELRDGLPDIDNSWGAYGADDDGIEVASSSDDSERDGNGDSYIETAYQRWRELGADERGPLGQAGILREQIDSIGPEPALHFAHVALPHRPWILSRTGIASSYEPPLQEDPNAVGYEFGVRLEYQMHEMQVGAADVLIGELVDRLRSLPNWDDTLLVVTTDHGRGMSGPLTGRMQVTDDNREEVYRTAMFIKAPGQTEGEIVDKSVQTIDLLPTMIDMLGGETDWEFDGHSLVDGSSAHTEPRVSTDVQVVFDIAAAKAEQFGGDDWIGLAAVGEHRDLVGRDVAALDVGDPSELSASLDQESLLADLPTSDGTMPFVLAGTVRGDEPSSELVVAVNGRIAGVVGGYRPAVSGQWEFTGYVADLYREGANEVDLYEVNGSGSTATLHEVERT
ncbi:MAG: sulfatase-like hydrolase/transferase [Ilumatobacteraceae bacterium]